MIIKKYKLASETDQTIKMLSGSQVLSVQDRNYNHAMNLFILEPDAGVKVPRQVILRREDGVVPEGYVYAGVVDYYGRMPEDDGHWHVFVGEEY